MSADIATTDNAMPILAILTMDDPSKGFRGNRRNFIDIIDAGKQAKVNVYVTTVNHLELQANNIMGFIYNPQQRSWERQWCPAPQVIYNRIPYREDEYTPEVQKKIDDCIQHPHIQLFNHSFFNKWMLFKWLSNSKKTKHFIPVTKKYEDEMKLLPLIKKYRFLYLKPERGKAGKGIMRIRRGVNKKFRYIIDTHERSVNMVFRYPTVRKLKEKVKECIGSDDYIVQQGIQLASFNRRPFDLRVLVQKNRKGVWTVTGIGARLAGELSITTHVPRGGSIEDPRRLLAHNFSGLRAQRILGRVKQSALIIAKQIERRAGAELGELSLDLGVDRRARLWFFEANSKPMKFDEPHIRKKSLVKLMQYCHYLVRHQAGGKRNLNQK
jgi:hypothetical protein